MRTVCFASGSTGNCALVSSGGDHVLIDAGISLRRMTACLAGLGLRPGDLSAVLITHEHSDHISGLAALVKRHEVPILAPRTVANNICRTVVGVDDFIVDLPVGEYSPAGGLSVLPFHTPHDTPESVGYRIEGDASLGFCTDLGRVTDEVWEAMRGVEAAVIESNHDEDMLRYGPYPVHLKRRILSDHGHLSNDCCADFAAALAESGTRYITLAHLSRENNTPQKARAATASALSGALQSGGVTLSVAPPAELCVIDTEVSSRCSR